MLNFSCNVRSIEYEDLRRQTIIIDCHYIQHQIHVLQIYDCSGDQQQTNPTLTVIECSLVHSLSFIFLFSFDYIFGAMINSLLNLLVNCLLLLNPSIFLHQLLLLILVFMRKCYTSAIKKSTSRLSKEICILRSRVIE